MRHRLVLCLAAVAGTGCVKAEFAPLPRVACAGDTTAIRWSARGTTSLTMAVFPGVASDSLAGGGRADTVRLRLTAERFGRTTVSAPTEVVVVSGRAPRVLGGRTVPLGRDSVAWADSVPEGDAPAVLRLATVASRAGRAVVAAHGGRAVVLGADGAPSAAFAGLPLAGPWTLRAALLPGEVMGDAAHPPPRLLSAALVVTCTARGP